MTNPTNKPKIILQVEGGVLQAAYSDLANLRVEVVDIDNLKEFSKESPEYRAGIARLEQAAKHLNELSIQ